MVPILIISAKLDTLVFRNKGYDVIISVHEATNKILSRHSNHIADVVMWPKSSISVDKLS